ncbi:MAG: hypothetical protein H6900_11205 [Rhodobacter sp.]|nr:hypothetical protein [Paracoccaceae bacterium]MCC0073842.1 hypothetical protein [Rhodobacter sp.]
MRLVLGSVLLLAAAPASAFTPERAAMMVDAIRANGCSMAGDQAEEALSPLGLNGTEVQAFVDTLFGADLVSLSADMSVLTLSEGLCAAEGDAALAMITAAFAAQEATLEPWRPDFAPERGAEFVGAVRGNDCTLTEESASDLLPPLGFSPADTRDIVAVLIDGGLAQVNDDGNALSLSPEFCAAESAGDAAALAALIDGWDDRHADANSQPEGDQ